MIKVIDISCDFKLPGILSFIRLKLRIYTSYKGLTIEVQGKHVITIAEKDIVEIKN
jgi:hypothetical protein